MSNHINPAAEQARENARTTEGRFGEQPHADAGQLGLVMSNEAAQTQYDRIAELLPAGDDPTTNLWTLGKYDRLSENDLDDLLAGRAAAVEERWRDQLADVADQNAEQMVYEAALRAGYQPEQVDPDNLADLRMQVRNNDTHNPVDRLLGQTRPQLVRFPLAQPRLGDDRMTVRNLDPDDDQPTSATVNAHRCDAVRRALADAGMDMDTLEARAAVADLVEHGPDRWDPETIRLDVLTAGYVSDLRVSDEVGAKTSYRFERPTVALVDTETGEGAWATIPTPATIDLPGNRGGYGVRSEVAPQLDSGHRRQGLQDNYHLSADDLLDDGYRRNVRRNPDRNRRDAWMWQASAPNPDLMAAGLQPDASIEDRRAAYATLTDPMTPVKHRRELLSGLLPNASADDISSIETMLGSRHPEAADTMFNQLAARI